MIMANIKPKGKAKKSIVISAVNLLLSLILLISAVYAWFAMQKTNIMGGLSMDTRSPKIAYGDTISIARYFNNGNQSVPIHYNYLRDEKNRYYLHDGTDYVKDEDDNFIPISIVGLLPTEILDITLTVVGLASLSGYNFTVGFTGLSGDELTNKEGVSYSVLGVYKACWLDKEVIGGETQFYETTYHWLADYTKTPHTPNYLEIKGGAWADLYDNTTNSVTVHIRLTVDTSAESQYRGLELDSPLNKLSEAQASIRGIFADVTEIR